MLFYKPIKPRLKLLIFSSIRGANRIQGNETYATVDEPDAHS